MSIEKQKCPALSRHCPSVVNEDISKDLSCDAIFIIFSIHSVDKCIIITLKIPDLNICPYIL